MTAQFPLNPESTTPGPRNRPWSPYAVNECSHRVKGIDATILVSGLTPTPYRQCTLCSAEVQR